MTRLLRRPRAHLTTDSGSGLSPAQTEEAYDSETTPTSDDDRQLKRAIDVLRHTTGVDLTFGGVVARGRHAQLTEFVGNSTRALIGLTLGFGMGLGGKAVALHRPIAVNDYANSRRISHHYDLMVAEEGIRAMVAAPVVVNRTVRAVMYGAVRQSVGLGDRTVDAVMDSARALEQNLAVRDEVRRRLAELDGPPAGTTGRRGRCPPDGRQSARHTPNCGSSPSTSPTPTCGTGSPR